MRHGTFKVERVGETTKNVLVVGDQVPDEMIEGLKSSGFVFLSPSLIQEAKDVPSEISEVMFYDPQARFVTQRNLEHARVKRILERASIRQTSSVTSLQAICDRAISLGLDRQPNLSTLRTPTLDDIRACLPPSWQNVPGEELKKQVQMELMRRGYRVIETRISEAMCSIRSHARTKASKSAKSKSLNSD